MMVSPSPYNAIVEHLRRSFRSGKTRPYKFRMAQLDALRSMITENSDELCLAVQQDLRRSHYETYSYELQSVLNEIDGAKSSLSDWMKPKKVRRTVIQLMDQAQIKKDPLGTVLIVGPWNYPLILLLQPLAGALAAGNCAIVKPSEVAQHTCKAIADLIPKYLDTDVVRVITGGVSETTELLKERFDHIFYTGSTNVGKIVMEAASKHLTPVTLELGGKSPVVVDSTVDPYVAAKRIAWGKFLNAGQTCVAPDYVLCVHSMKDKLISQLKVVIQEFFGDDALSNEDYARVVTERHFDRVNNLLQSSGTIAHGGGTDRSNKFIEPTILDNVSATDPIMQEEIFGPILPVLSVNDILEAVEFINDREKPLALYIFSKDSGTVDHIVNHTSSGGITVNDCILHMALDTLPFGGVGHSGIGRYHGKFSYDTFSHEKAVLKRGFSGEAMLWMRYPPLTASKFKWAQFITKKRPLPDKKLFIFIAVLIFGAVVGFFIGRYA